MTEERKGVVASKKKLLIGSGRRLIHSRDFPGSGVWRLVGKSIFSA